MSESGESAVFRRRFLKLSLLGVVICLPLRPIVCWSRMERVAGDLTHPVFIISQEEARQLVGLGMKGLLRIGLRSAFWLVGKSICLRRHFTHLKQEMERVSGRLKLVEK